MKCVKLHTLYMICNKINKEGKEYHKNQEMLGFTAKISHLRPSCCEIILLALLNINLQRTNHVQQETLKSLKMIDHKSCTIANFLGIQSSLHWDDKILQV